MGQTEQVEQVKAFIHPFGMPISLNYPKQEVREKGHWSFLNCSPALQWPTFLPFKIKNFLFDEK